MVQYATQLADISTDSYVGKTMTELTRRALLQRATISMATVVGLNAIRRSAFGGADDRPKFTMSLRCGSIGVRADQKTAIRLAHKHGFESVTPDARFLADLSDQLREQLLEEMKDKKLTWGAAGLPVQFHGDVRAFTDGIEQLPRLANGMQRAGVVNNGQKT